MGKMVLRRSFSGGECAPMDEGNVPLVDVMVDDCEGGGGGVGMD